MSQTRVLEAMPSVDLNMPVISIRTLREQVAVQFGQQRLIARLTSFFGVLSLILASIGLYGVTAYNVGLRVGEIGVRMALGADRRRIVTMVVRGASTLIVLGLGIGFPLTFAVGKFLGSQLAQSDSDHCSATSAQYLTRALPAPLTAATAHKSTVSGSSADDGQLKSNSTCLVSRVISIGRRNPQVVSDLH